MHVKNDNPCLAAALAYAANKQRPIYVFPCPPGEKKSYYSGAYDPDHKNWGATTNEDRIRKYWQQRPQANVCIPTGLINSLFIVETDTKEGHPKLDVEGEESLAALVKQHGGGKELPVTRMARSPTGSIHRYFNYPDDDNIKIIGGAGKLGVVGVDVLGDGEMALVPPSVRSLKDTRRYEWINPEQGIANAPRWLIDLVIEKDVERQPSEPEAPFGLVERALELLSNDENSRWQLVDDDGVVKEFSGWDGWNRVMMAVYRATGGSDQGFEIADKWSAKNPRFNHDINRGYNRNKWFKRLAKKPPDKIGAGWLFAVVNEEPGASGWRSIWEDEHPDDLETWEQDHPDDDSDVSRSQAKTDDEEVVSADKPSGTAHQDNKPDHAAADAAGSNPDPVDLWGKFDPPELPIGLLPAAIEKYARVEGGNMGCDPAGLAMAALTVCAAVISDTIRLQPKEYDEQWTEPARVWTALVGLPSTMKSPILNQAAWPAGRIDRKLIAQYLAEKEAYDELSAADKKKQPSPKQPRIKIEDTTIEAAQEVLKDSPDGVLCLQDELSGFFGMMDKHSGKGAGADRAFWMKAYNGGPSTYNRIARGSGLIPNLSVCLLGGIQPDAIRKVAADTVDDGLLQRMLFIVLRPATAGQDKPRDPVVNDYFKLADKLHELLPPQQQGFNDNESEDTVLRFDQGAQAIRNRLVQKHIDLEATLENVNKKLATHVGKYNGVFARLCVLWHCIENVDQRILPTEVTEDTARRVARFLHDFILKHAVAFYAGTLGLSDDHERLANVANFILARKLSKITNRDVQRGDRSMRRLADRDTLRIFEQLEALGWVERRLPKKPQEKLQWIVNPQVHIRFADRAKREADRRADDREGVAEFFK
jgi:hypothetical protein